MVDDEDDELDDLLPIKGDAQTRRASGYTVILHPQDLMWLVELLTGTYVHKPNSCFSFSEKSDCKTLQ